jgi:hypothetical protein
MNTDRQVINISGLSVEVVRKDIKNLHLGVYPPNGRVRIAAPLSLSNDAVRLAVIGKLGWIKRHQSKFKEQLRQSMREMVSGESHYFLGQRYRLRVIENNWPAKVTLRRNASMDLSIRKASSTEEREQVLLRWYRTQLKALIPPILDKWQSMLGVKVAEWGVKKMKTKWGSCNPIARRIWLNLELAKKPVQCLEYIILHEMIHLLERHHNDRFTAYMDKFMPRWRQIREILNKGPLGHEIWNY